MPDKTLAEILKDLSTRIRTVESPQNTALCLIGHVLRQSKSWILAHPETELDQQALFLLHKLSDRLLKGEPLAYLIGLQEFFKLEFLVSPAVLIPRPETELLVEEALDWLQQHPERRNLLDVGTGSGCIAISLVKNCLDLHADAADISREALDIALLNAKKHAVDDHIEFFETNLFPNLNKNYDLICANLPYIPSSKLVEVNSRSWEPALALDGGEDGFNVFRNFMKLAPFRVNLSSLLLLEIESTLGKESLALSRKAFPQANITLLKDLAGKDRLIRIELS